jgi:hypothetical protein
MSADENIGVAVDGLIVDAIAIGDVTCEDARFKVAIHKTGIHTHNNERLRRWIAIAAHPVGIHTTDWARQVIGGSVHTDRPGLTVVAGELTIGLERGDRSSCYSVLDETGRASVMEQQVATAAKAATRGGIVFLHYVGDHVLRARIPHQHDAAVAAVPYLRDSAQFLMDFLWPQMLAMFGLGLLTVAMLRFDKALD